MLKADAQQRGERQTTRERIIAAAIASLREEGFAGTSARSIARHGDFNQALIFYHFGSVPDLLVTTLETVAEARLQAYRKDVARVSDLGQAVELARRNYRRDLDEGHITVLTELIAGASSMPELGPELVRCVEPWIAFATETIARLLQGTMLERVVRPRDIASTLVALYLGMELLDHLDLQARVSTQLFGVAYRLAKTVEPLLRTDAPRVKSRPQRIAITDH